MSLHVCIICSFTVQQPFVCQSAPEGGLMGENNLVPRLKDEQCQTHFLMLGWPRQSRTVS